MSYIYAFGFSSVQPIAQSCRQPHEYGAPGYSISNFEFTSNHVPWSTMPSSHPSVIPLLSVILFPSESMSQLLKQWNWQRKPLWNFQQLEEIDCLASEWDSSLQSKDSQEVFSILSSKCGNVPPPALSFTSIVCPENTNLRPVGKQ